MKTTYLGVITRWAVAALVTALVAGLTSTSSLAQSAGSAASARRAVEIPAGDTVDVAVKGSLDAKNPTGAPAPDDLRALPGELIDLDAAGRPTGPVVRSRYRVDDSGKIIGEAQAGAPLYVEHGRQLVSLLPKAIRTGHSYVEVAFSGVARDLPEHGTIMNIDGAIIGFSAKRNGEKSGPAEMMVLDVNSEGKRFWRRTGYIFAFTSTDQLIESPRINVVFGAKAPTWALQVGGFTILESITLLDRADQPMALLTPGPGAERALINRLAVKEGVPDRAPSPRPALPNRSATR